MNATQSLIICGLAASHFLCAQEILPGAAPTPEPSPATVRTEPAPVRSEPTAEPPIVSTPVVSTPVVQAAPSSNMAPADRYPATLFWKSAAVEQGKIVSEIRQSVLRSVRFRDLFARVRKVDPSAAQEMEASQRKIAFREMAEMMSLTSVVASKGYVRVDGQELFLGDVVKTEFQGTPYEFAVIGIRSLELEIEEKVSRERVILKVGETLARPKSDPLARPRRETADGRALPPK